MIEYLDMPQGIPEWFEARLGIPTASMFHAVQATTARERSARDTYMRKLVGERLTGRPMASANVSAMQRGHEREPEALAMYALLQEVEVRPIGFVRAGKYGCSPDGLVGTEGCVEVKDAEPHVQIARLLDGDVPKEYWHQVLGHLLVTGRAWCDFVSHCRGLPPLIVRVPRALVANGIAALRVDLDQFCTELDELTERIRSM